MNKTKKSSLVRLIAFFLIAVLMVCTFGFTSDGWLIGSSSDKSNNQSNGENDNVANNGSVGNEIVDPLPEVIVPNFFNPLTGLEASEADIKRIPLSFIMDGNCPIYGASYSDVLIELPTEGGNTRIVSITSNRENLWKIGSLEKSRDYISYVSHLFGAIEVNIGEDKAYVEQKLPIQPDSIDLTRGDGFYYTEHSFYNYTNVNLINSAISLQNKQILTDEKRYSPFVFGEYGGDRICYDRPATSVLISTSASSSTGLKFNAESQKYTLLKNGIERRDLLSDSKLEFTNCLILFADSITYEGTSGTQTVIKTHGEGNGFYLTNGTLTSICWYTSPDGRLTFTNAVGENLIINRGTTYISYVKSSLADSVSIE